MTIANFAQGQLDAYNNQDIEAFLSMQKATVVERIDLGNTVMDKK